MSARYVFIIGDETGDNINWRIAERVEPNKRNPCAFYRLLSPVAASDVMLELLSKAQRFDELPDHFDLVGEDEEDRCCEDHA